MRRIALTCLSGILVANALGVASSGHLSGPADFVDDYSTDTTAAYERKDCGSANGAMEWLSASQAARIQRVEQGQYRPIGASFPSDGEVLLDVTFERLGDLDGNSNGRQAAIALRHVPAGSHCDTGGVWGGFWTLGPCCRGGSGGTKYAYIVQNGEWQTAALVPFDYAEGTTYHLRLVVEGSAARLYVNDQFVVGKTGLTALSSGNTGLWIASCAVPCGSKSSVRIDNWVVNPHVDTAPPVIFCDVPGPVEATGPNGAIVTWTCTATDSVDGDLPVTCRPPSGSTFSINTTPVHCTATDAAQNTASFDFDVTVRDTTPPIFICSPPNRSPYEAEAREGRYLEFECRTEDVVDRDTDVCWWHQWFPITSTPITCTVRDSHGNGAEHADIIVVQDTTAPVTTDSWSGDLRYPDPPIYRGPVLITLECTDVASDCHIYFKLDEGAWTTYVSAIPITARGNYTLCFYAQDDRPNVEPFRCRQFRIADPPSAPRNLVARPGPGRGQISLDWDAPLDDGGDPIYAYLVRRAATEAGPYSDFPTLDARTHHYVDHGLSDGATFWYLLVAVNRVEPGPPSDAKSARTFTVPSAPQNVRATPRVSGGADVTWEDPADNGGTPVTTFDIYRSCTGLRPPSPPFKFLGNVTASQHSFPDAETQKIGNLCTYQVYANNLVGRGPPGTSNQAPGTQP